MAEPHESVEKASSLAGKNYYSNDTLENLLGIPAATKNYPCTQRARDET
jgi:hypothetical protein